MTCEKGQRNIKLTYLNDFDIYYIDYDGIISFDKGISNMAIIKDELQDLSINRVCLKILFDFSNTIWENQETHDSLSRIARKIFDSQNFDVAIYSAIINNEIEGSTFENEHWFVDKDNAIKWLVEKT